VTLPTAVKIGIARVLRRIVGIGRLAVGRRGSEVVCRRRGVTWSLDLDEGVQFALYLGLYERDTAATLSRLCPDDAIVLDVGANVGAQALPLAAALSASATVIAVEPTDAAFARFQRNLALNPGLASRVRPMHLALGAEGDAPQAAYFSAWPLGQADNLHPIHRGAPQPSSAPVSTLDALLRTLDVRRLDLIKLDVDGHELPVLRGAGETLARLRPTVVFEFCPYLLEERREAPDALLSLLDAAGYAFRDARGRAIPDRDRLIRSIPHGAGVNIVAVPR
jgi:FkbM family methyltransferase